MWTVSMELGSVNTDRPGGEDQKENKTHSILFLGPEEVVEAAGIWGEGEGMFPEQVPPMQLFPEGHL